jgi:uncharacterized protein (TIGR03067 family)
VIDGKAIPTGRGVILTSGPDGYTVTVNGKVYQRGTSKADMSTSPPQSEVLVGEEPQAGQTIHQIFKVEGDVLISCQARPGADRPTEFASRPGSGHVLSVWLRVSPTIAVRSPPPVWVVVALFALACVLGGLAESLMEQVGRWAGLAAGAAAGVAIFTSIGLLLRWTAQAAVALGLTIVAFDMTAPSLEPLWATVASGSAGLVAAVAIWTVASRLLKVDAHSYTTSS